MLGREHHEGGAEERVGAGREHADLFVRMAHDLEIDVGAFRATDPVPLQPQGRGGPIDPVQVVQESLSVLGDLEKPLVQVSLRHLSGTALAAAVDDLLIRQNSLAGRAPVHRRLSAFGQTGFEKLQEDPLGPLVVFRLGDIDDAIPVVHEPHSLQLAGEVRDVTRDQLSRMDALLEGEILRVDAERIEADRLEDIQALKLLIAAVDVGSGKSVDVADMEPLPRGVGVHHQVVEGSLGPIQIDPVEPGFFPTLLPLRLECTRIVPVRHRQPTSLYRR